MTALFALWRVAAWNSGRRRGLRWEGRKGVLRWPDKSAAVGVGAGDWNKAIIPAVALTGLLALLSISAMFSERNAPSAADDRNSAASP